MKRAELESTSPIKRDVLLPLLAAMEPTDKQPVTSRVRISDIEDQLTRSEESAIAEKLTAAAKPVEPDAPRLFTDVDWDAILNAAMPPIPPLPKAGEADAPKAEVKAKPKRKRPFSQLAALLPPTVPKRFPRATQPLTNRAKSETGSPSEQKALQAVADVREKLDVEMSPERDAMYERGPFPVLSPKVVGELSAEEIAMLPMEIRLTLPEVEPQQRISGEMPVVRFRRTAPRDVVYVVPPADAIVTPPVMRIGVVTIVKSFAAAFAIGLCLVYAALLMLR